MVMRLTDPVLVTCLLKTAAVLVALHGADGTT